MSYYDGFSFETTKNKVEDLSINVEITDNELARAIKLSDANEFYRIFNSREGMFDADQSIAGREFAEYNSATDKQRWMTEKLWYSMLNPDVFMNLLCVVANGKKKIFPTKFVEDCKRVLVAAVKKGVDVYANISYVIEGERDQREFYDNNPPTIESKERWDTYKEAVGIVVDMEKQTPYKKIFDSIESVVDVELKLEEAEEDGDSEKIIVLSKQLEAEKAHMETVVSSFDPNMLSRIAKSHQNLVKMTADPEKKVSLKEKREEAIVANLYVFAKKLEAERLERQQLDDEMELRQLQEMRDYRNGDNDDKK